MSSERGAQKDSLLRGMHKRMGGANRHVDGKELIDCQHLPRGVVQRTDYNTHLLSGVGQRMDQTDRTE
jgi:hypothetical protein